MTVTALPQPAEAPEGTPRRLSLQTWLATQSSRIDLDSPQTVDNRTWLELVSAYAFHDLTTEYTERMLDHVWSALRRGELARGGFLSDEVLCRKAIRAALASGCADVLAREVGQS